MAVKLKQQFAQLWTEIKTEVVPISPGSRRDWAKWTSVMVASLLIPGGVVIPLICLTMKAKQHGKTNQ